MLGWLFGSFLLLSAKGQQITLSILEPMVTIMMTVMVMVMQQTPQLTADAAHSHYVAILYQLVNQVSVIHPILTRVVGDKFIRHRSRLTCPMTFITNHSHSSRSLPQRSECRRPEFGERSPVALDLQKRTLLPRFPTQSIPTHAAAYASRISQQIRTARVKRFSKKIPNNKNGKLAYEHIKSVGQNLA